MNIELYRQLLDTAPDAIVVVDHNGQIVLVNIQAERLFDYARQDLLGQRVEVLIPERLRVGHVGHRDSFFAEPNFRPMGQDVELLGRKKDGTEFPVEISLSPVTVAQGTLVSASIRDVTDRKNHERELQHAHAQANAASAAKSEFLASMSHELRTPLNAILGFAQLLQRDKKTPLSERQQERISHVLKGGEHLLRLIDEVLDLSRIEAGQVMVSPEPVSLLDVLSEVELTLASMAARAGIQLHIAELPTGLPMVWADRTRLMQVLMNYGSNAIKYGRRGGHCTFRSEQLGDRLRVTVIDDGVGIGTSQQDKVFQPFHRAGQETGPIEGTGIGLAISKRLAELMGSRVGFSSREAVGSQFWIDVPIHDANEKILSVDQQSARQLSVRLTNDATAPNGADHQTHLIVYIEDNPSNIAFMEDLLSDLEYVRLMSAHTAEIGIELVRTHQPMAVIMDINLPGMSGFEALRRLKEWPETASIPVIALSAAAMVRDAARVNRAGFYQYLTKPVKVDELTRVLEELLH